MRNRQVAFANNDASNRGLGGGAQRRRLMNDLTNRAILVLDVGRVRVQRLRRLETQEADQNKEAKRFEKSRHV